MDVISHLTRTVTPAVLGDDNNPAKRNLLEQFYAIFAARLADKDTYGRFANENIAFAEENIDFAEENLAFTKENIAFDKGDLDVANENLAFTKASLAFAKEDIDFVTENIIFIKGNGEDNNYIINISYILVHYKLGILGRFWLDPFKWGLLKPVPAWAS